VTRICVLHEYSHKNKDTWFSMHDTISGMTLLRCTHYQKIGKPNNLIVFSSKKIKGPNTV
jgi:hypothetical protein